MFDYIIFVDWIVVNCKKNKMKKKKFDYPGSITNVIIYSLIQMFSEFSNHQFLSIIQQFFLSLYFLYYFVAEFIINIVLLIYRTILRLLLK